MTILQAMRAPLGAVCAWAITGAAWAQGGPASDTAADNEALRAALREAAAREAALREQAVRLSDQQLQILQGLSWLLVLVVVVGAVLIWTLQRQTKALADEHPELRERYAALPFGVPEGTVRGLVSVLIIIMGIAVLVVQGPLGIRSTEAVAGFISAVIAFYFVTREQAQTTTALRDSVTALNRAAVLVDKANEDIATLRDETRALSFDAFERLEGVVVESMRASYTARQQGFDMGKKLKAGGYAFGDNDLEDITDKALTAVRANPEFAPFSSKIILNRTNFVLGLKADSLTSDLVHGLAQAIWKLITKKAEGAKP